MTAMQWKRLGAFGLTMLLAACTDAPVRNTATAMGKPGAAAVSDTAIDAIYEDLKQANASADVAIARYRLGDAAQATWRLREARETLSKAAARCSSTAGCDLSRVLAAHDALVGRIAIELTGGVADGDPSTGRVEAGEQGTADGTDSPVLRSVPQAATTVQLLHGRTLDEAIAMNPAVKAALEEWLTWLRPFLLDTWENYQYLRPRMGPVYEKAGLPEALLFGIMAKESGGKVHSISTAGASGPFQFMPATARRLGLGFDNGMDQRFDAAAAAKANAAYLNEQFAQLNQNLELALAAYNSGEGRIDRLTNHGQRGYWDPNVYAALPPETRDYVPMVLAASWLFLHPEKYGLSFPRYDATPAQVTLGEATTINQLAICMGQEGNPRGWFRTLRNLNPRYEPETVIPAGTQLDLPKAAAAAFQKNCLGGERVALANDLHSAYVPKPVAVSVMRSDPRRGGGSGSGGGAAGPGSYKVRSGDTLGAIGTRFRCNDIATLARANGLKPPYALKPGQVLNVSVCH